MKPTERDLLLYLEDITVSMQRVHEYISGFDFQRFKHDYKTVDPVIRNFEVIGEAAKKLPQPFKDEYPGIPWEQMYRLRNRISHEYFGVDYEIIWDIATKHLPKNYADISEIVRQQKLKRNK